jgi:hypothetical protein
MLSGVGWGDLSLACWNFPTCEFFRVSRPHFSKKNRDTGNNFAKMGLYCREGNN